MPPEKKGFEFYHDTLGSPKYVVAPMVDGSELAWRELGRRYKADLCYSPMYNAGMFVRDAKYRRDALQTCPTDRPLIIQFCANDPDLFTEAARLTAETIDAQGVDLNLGCPQVIARRGHFGSYLQDEWELITSIISKATKELDIPITAKCRVFDDINRSIEYAQMLERAGAQLITVHGRTRDQKGPLTGLASWEHIKAVREAVSVPVFANGNIQYLDDADRCIRETGVQGVMSAEGHLTNPAIFAGINPPVWDVAIEYLDLVDKYPCPTSYVRGHMFKLLNHCFMMKQNFDLREVIARSHSLPEFRQTVFKLKERFADYHSGEKTFEMPDELKVFNLKFPPWICQPYVRAPPEQYLEKMKRLADEQQKREREAAEAQPPPPAAADASATGADKKREGDEAVQQLSRRKRKKLERKMKKLEHMPKDINSLLGGYKFEPCVNCGMPSGLKCGFKLCKRCCKTKCFTENHDCAGHKIMTKTNRANAKLKYGDQYFGPKKKSDQPATTIEDDVAKTTNPKTEDQNVETCTDCKL